jgi:hypothetical protein
MQFADGNSIGGRQCRGVNTPSTPQNVDARRTVCCHSARVTADTSRLVVVRAWLDSQRIIVRVLAGAGHSKPADEWVFADIDAACGQIANVLRELLEHREQSAQSDTSASLIQSIDAALHHGPPE